MAAWHCHATPQSYCDTRQEEIKKSKMGLEEKKKKWKEKKKKGKVKGGKERKRGRIQAKN
jgi:hypothetical protein